MKPLPVRVRLRALRRRHKLTWREMAALVGCHLDTYRWWESLNPKYQHVPNLHFALELERVTRDLGDCIPAAEWFGLASKRGS